MEELPPEHLPGLRHEERRSAGGVRGLWWCKLCNTDANWAHTLSTEHLGKARAECVAEGLRLDAALGLPTSQWSTSASASSAPCPAGETAAVTFGQTAAAGPAASAAAKPNFRFKPPPPSCANYKPPPPVLTGYADQGARHVERLQQHVTQLDLRVEALEVRMGAPEQQLQAHGAQTGMAQAAGGSATDGSGGRPLATVTSVQGRRRHAEHPAAVGSRVPRWIACQK